MSDCRLWEDFGHAAARRCWPVGFLGGMHGAANRNLCLFTSSLRPPKIIQTVGLSWVDFAAVVVQVSCVFMHIICNHVTVQKKCLDCLVEENGGLWDVQACTATASSQRKVLIGL